MISATAPFNECRRQRAGVAEPKQPLPRLKTLIDLDATLLTSTNTGIVDRVHAQAESAATWSAAVVLPMSSTARHRAGA
jgi:hypothetical protein